MSEKQPSPLREHHNLNQVVAGIMKNGVTFTPVEQNDTILPERNALGAIILNNAFLRGETERQRGRRGPFGLLNVAFNDHCMTGFHVIDSLPQRPEPGIVSRISGRDRNYIKKLTQDMSTYMNRTMTYDLLQECDRMSSLPEDTFDRRIYDRLQQLTEGSIAGRHCLEKNSAFHFVARPGTGTSTLRRIALLLYDFSSSPLFSFSSPPSLSTLAVMLRNSYSVCTSTAAGDLEVGMSAVLDLVDPFTGDYKKDKFNLEHYKDGQRLALQNWSALMRSQWESYASRSSRTIVTTGCPALASTGIIQGTPREFKNVIDGTVHWYADILEAVERMQ